MTKPILVLPNVTSLQKGNMMHMQIAKGVVLFQEDIPMAIQVVVCKQKEGFTESMTQNCLQLYMH